MGGGRPYGASDKALARLYERLLAGQNSTLGGCHFVKSLRRGERASFYVVRELGRTPEVFDVVADDDIIFAGCWWVRTKQAGKLIHLGAHSKSDDVVSPTAWPADIASLPYVVRRAIPVIITLDGAVFYPQLIDVDVAFNSKGIAMTAQFLAR